MADITQRLLHQIVAKEPLRMFVQQDAEYAMRVLMSKSSTVEQRNTASVRAALEDGVRRGHIRPAMDLDALAYVIIRIGAITAIRILLTAEKRSERWTIP